MASSSSEPSLKRVRSASTLLQLLDAKVRNEFSVACRISVPQGVVDDAFIYIVRKLHTVAPIATSYQITAALSGLAPNLAYVEVVTYLVYAILCEPLSITTSIALIFRAVKIVQPRVTQQMANTNICSKDPLRADPSITNTYGQILAILAQVMQLYIAQLDDAAMRILNALVEQATHICRNTRPHGPALMIDIQSDLPPRRDQIESASAFGNYGCTSLSTSVPLATNLDITRRTTPGKPHSSTGSCECARVLHVPHTNWNSCSHAGSKLAQGHIWGMIKRVTSGRVEQYSPQVLAVLVDELALMHGELVSLTTQDRDQPLHQLREEIKQCIMKLDKTQSDDAFMKLKDQLMENVMSLEAQITAHTRELADTKEQLLAQIKSEAHERAQALDDVKEQLMAQIKSEAQERAQELAVLQEAYNTLHTEQTDLKRKMVRHVFEAPSTSTALVTRLAKP
jgi:hypothetical protein